MRRVYLDNASTTPVHAEVLEAMLPFLSSAYGNPSSIHCMGREAREAVESSRDNVAALLGSQSSEVVFTSGGTEADNLAIRGTAYAMRHRGRHMITSAVEHHAVLNTLKALEQEGFEVTCLPVDRAGMVDPGLVEKSVRADTILISIMHANNEVGTIQPIEQIAQVAQKSNVPFHTDAVQTFGHIPTLVRKLGVDLLSVSAHKLYGPKGVGALYVRRATEISPLLQGGGQEGGLRPSTENVPGIVGFGKASQIASAGMGEREARVKKLRDRLKRAILGSIERSYLNGHERLRLPGNLNVTIRHVEGESVVLSLDRRGVWVSTGSACSAPNHESSHVLRAMGLPPDDLHSSVRFSLGAQNTRAEVDYATEALIEVVEKLRSMSPLHKGGRR